MTKSRACANAPALSRRNLMAGMTASGLAIASASDLTAATQADQSDPLVPLYSEWLDARRTWRELADLPGNEHWDDPRSLAAEARENAAEKAMLSLNPTSLEGIAALAALAWVYVSPGVRDPEEFAERAECLECRTVMAIWKACTGKEGYPVT